MIQNPEKKRNFTWAGSRKKREIRIRRGEVLSSYLRRYPDSYRSDRARLVLARINSVDGDLAESRELFREVLESSENDQVTSQARQELGKLNFTIFFSPEIDEDSQTYTVRSGDSLTSIARAYNTTPDLVKEDESDQGGDYPSRPGVESTGIQVFRCGEQII